MNFAFRTVGQIIFGSGKRKEAPKLVAAFGPRVLLITGGQSLERSGTLEEMKRGLRDAGAESTRWTVTGEPDLATVDEGARICREQRITAVLAIGGGSVLDAGKAAAALATNDGAAFDFIEEVGGGREFERASIPMIAVPTTAGSGSEVTRNSVLRIPHLAVKRSIRSDRLLPCVAVIDPELSSTAPPLVAASAGLDALTHLIEGYVSRGANPTTDALALPGITHAMRGLRALAEQAVTPSSSESLALASLWGGIVLANAGLGAAHGLVAPLGGRFCIAHGAACGCLLPGTIETNISALRTRAPTSVAFERYTEVARAVVRNEPATLERLVLDLTQLTRDLAIEPLARLGVKPADFADIIAGSRAGSMRYNPVDLTDGELENILSSAL